MAADRSKVIILAVVAGACCVPLLVIAVAVLFFFVKARHIETSEMSPDSVVMPQIVSSHDEAENELLIDIRTSGELAVNGAVLTPEALREKLRALVAAQAGQSVRLRGEDGLVYKQLMEVIDLCKEAGIWNISFATRMAEAD